MLIRGGSRGRAHPVRAPPKIEKNMIFWRKIVIFHTKYPKQFRASLHNWKNMIFSRKIVILLSTPPPPSLEILDPPLKWGLFIC